MITRIAPAGALPSICSSSSRVARSAISTIGWRTVVSWRRGALGDAEVVVPDHGHVVGYPPAGVGQHPQRAGGHQVGGDGDAVEVGVALEELAGGLLAAGLGEVADRHGVGRQVGRAHRLVPAVETVDGGGHVGWAGDGADPACTRGR